MSKKAQKTKRELKNQHSGLDMTIPEYVDRRGMLGTGTVMYKVIVITNLSYFKTDADKDTDVVQFSVDKRYTEFEKLQTDLMREFPVVPFPSLPPKIPNIMMTTNALEDRLVSFDSMVKKVAMHPKMSSSNSLLDFLGVSSHKRIEVFRKLKQKKKKAKKEEVKKEEEEEDEDGGIFSRKKVEKGKKGQGKKEEEEEGIVSEKNVDKEKKSEEKENEEEKEEGESEQNVDDKREREKKEKVEEMFSERKADERKMKGSKKEEEEEGEDEEGMFSERKADEGKKGSKEEKEEGEDEEGMFSERKVNEGKKKKKKERPPVNWDEGREEDEELFGKKKESHLEKKKESHLEKKGKERKEEEEGSPLLVRKVIEKEAGDEDDEDDELFLNLPKPQGGYRDGGLFDSDKPALFDDDSNLAADILEGVKAAKNGRDILDAEDHSELLNVEDAAEFEAKVMKTKPKPETKPKPNLKPKPAAKPSLQPKPETKPSPKPKPKAKPSLKPKPPPQPKPVTKPSLKPKPAAKPSLKPKPKAKPKSDEDDLFSIPTDEGTGSGAFDGDISKYIEANLQQQANDSLDLFS